MSKRLVSFCVIHPCVMKLPSATFLGCTTHGFIFIVFKGQAEILFPPNPRLPYSVLFARKSSILQYIKDTMLLAWRISSIIIMIIIVIVMTIIHFLSVFHVTQGRLIEIKTYFKGQAKKGPNLIQLVVRDNCERGYHVIVSHDCYIVI